MFGSGPFLTLGGADIKSSEWRRSFAAHSKLVDGQARRLT